MQFSRFSSGLKVQHSHLDFNQLSDDAEVYRQLRLASLVEVSGLEPLTSCLQSRRSTN